MSCPQTRGSCFQATGPLILRPLDSAESHHQLSWFSSLQAADHGTSWPPQPHDPIPIINLLLYAYWSCFSGEPCLMQPPIGFFIPCGPASCTLSSWVSLLAAWAAVTKHFQLHGLNIDICSLTVPEAGSPNSDCQQGHAPSKASRRGSFLASSVFGGPEPWWLVAASLWSLSLSSQGVFLPCLGVPVFTWHSFPHVSVFPSHKDISHVGLGPILVECDVICYL